MDQGWGKISAAAKYAGVSVRTMEDWLKTGILRYAQIPSGTRLIKYSWIDECLEKFEVQTNRRDVKAVNTLDDIIKNFRDKG